MTAHSLPNTEIHTQDLRLVAASQAMLEAELGADAGSRLETLVGATRPPSWPPELFERDDIERLLAQSRKPGHEGWGLWYLVRRACDASGDRLVGTAGFAGPPDDKGNVMIGYSVVAEARRQGLASQATAALVDHAFGDPRTQKVSAETFAELIPSIRVLEKCGFRPSDEAPETEGAIRFVLFR